MGDGIGLKNTPRLLSLHEPGEMLHLVSGYEQHISGFQLSISLQVRFFLYVM